MEALRPFISQEGSGYRVRFPDVEVEAVVREIKRAGGHYKAEVSVYHAGNSLHRSNYTLNSSTGMTALRRMLDERLPGPDYGIAWPLVVEGLAGIVIDTVREGTPEVVLGQITEDEGLRWRIDNLIIEQDANVLWADGGTGKSMFALFLATLVSEGYADTRHGLVIEPGSVLYLDYETSSTSISSRIRRIHKGLGIDGKSNIVYKRMHLPLSEDIDTIRDIVYKHDSVLLIVDSMGLAVAGELESAENVLDYFSALDLIPATSLTITHSNRAGTIFGSAFTSNRARSVWEAKQTAGGHGSDSIDFSLFHRKANDVPYQSAQSWRVEFKDDTVTYKRIDTFDTEARGELGYGQLVQKFLDEGPRTREELTGLIAELKSISSSDARGMNKLASALDHAIANHVKNSVIIDNAGVLSATTGDDTWTL